MAGILLSPLGILSSGWLLPGCPAVLAMRQIRSKSAGTVGHTIQLTCGASHMILLSSAPLLQALKALQHLLADVEARHAAAQTQLEPTIAQVRCRLALPFCLCATAPLLPRASPRVPRQPCVGTEPVSMPLPAARGCVCPATPIPSCAAAGAAEGHRGPGQEAFWAAGGCKQFAEPESQPLWARALPPAL
jgi:hypothetical protein